MENKFHKHFQLNEKSFDTVDEILEFTSNISTEIYTFLQDWFSDKPTIAVQTSVFPLLNLQYLFYFAVNV